MAGRALRSCSPKRSHPLTFWLASPPEASTVAPRFGSTASWTCWVRSAGYTGNGTTAFAADRQGNVDGFAYSVQGNILTSERVLAQAAHAFEQTGCDLAERLMTALEAGAQGGEGDSRCTPHGIPSDSAFLQVESADGSPTPSVALHVTSSGKDDPLPLLRQKLEAWRVDHPCPTLREFSGAPQNHGGCSFQKRARQRG